MVSVINYLINNEVGILPKILHELISNVFKEFSFPKEVGNSPENPLSERYRSSRLVRFPSEGGIFPDKEGNLISK